MAVQRDRESSELVRDVNDRVAELYRADDEGDELGFVCECGAKDCVGVVRLSASEYAALRERGPILMDGHSPSSGSRYLHPPGGGASPSQ